MSLILPTGETIDPAMVNRMVDEFARTNGARRTVMAGELLTIGVRLNALRIDLDTRLSTGYDYLEANATHRLDERLGLMASDADPEREAVWIGWVHDYETCVDLQDRIKRDVVMRIDATAPELTQAVI
jgi:hypothetical protein